MSRNFLGDFSQIFGNLPENSRHLTLHPPIVRTHPLPQVQVFFLEMVQLYTNCNLDICIQFRVYFPPFTGQNENLKIWVISVIYWSFQYWIFQITYTEFYWIFSDFYWIYQPRFQWFECLNTCISILFSGFNEHSSGLNTSWFRQKVSFLSTYCWATARRDWITKISHVLKPYTSWVSHVCPSPKFKAGRRYCVCSSKVLRSTTGFFNLLKFYAQCFPLKFSTYLLSFLLIKVYSILFK